MLTKKLNNTDLREIKDHIENTARDYIKVYTVSQLSLMDGIDTRTVKTSGKFLPVRIDTGQSINQYKLGNTKKPYMVGYIRMDEIQQIFSKRNRHKKLSIEV